MTERLLPEEALAFPLSFGQQRLWLLDRLLADRAAYNVPTFLAVQGPLSVAALAAAFAAVVERHEVLRTTFATLDGEPVQVVGEPFAPPLPVVNLEALPAARCAGEAALLAAREAARPFDLGDGPLLRLTLLRLGQEEHHLLLDLHHIVCDEWSMGVLVREVGALYLGRELPELPLQYADFAVWQREEAEEGIAADLAFWRGELAEAPTVLDLPLDRPRSASTNLAADAVPFAVAPDVFAALKTWVAEAHGSSFMLLAAAFGALLARHSGQSDLLLGAPAAYRNRSELEGLVGFFLNTLVLRLAPHPGRSWDEYFAEVRATAVAAFAHQDVPFERLVAELAPGHDRTGAAPLVQVLLSFEGAPDAPPDLPGLELAPLALPGVSAKFELNLNAGEHGGGLAGALTFWTGLFDRPTVARMAGQLAALLGGVAADPRRRLGELPLLAAAERHQALVEWNDTEEPVADAAPLHHLFLRQAAERPDGVAVVFEDVQLSYAGLEARSARWAGWLASRGVGAEARVGVALERSAELPGVLLGVLRAGGAYVPLDPGQPAERLAELVADAAPVLVLGEKDLKDIRDVKDCKDLGSASLENLAAVIYTSGSTGRPKGVMVPHAGLVNRLLWSRRSYPVGPGDRVLQKGSLVFDISVWEIFGPLVAGGTCVLLPPGDHLHADRVAAALERHEITMVHSVPSMLGALAAEPALRRHRSLRWLFSGGEALPLALRHLMLEILPGRMHNQYGPTETSIDVTFGVAADPDPSFRAASLGRPMANTRLHVVDEAGGLVPPGGLGELWIGGANLTRGYWRRPERTAASFVPDPFGGAPGGRLYRTGDRVRHLADGRLEYAGRLDGQVKVRGVRIELGEIEAALAALPEVREAAAAVREGAAGPQIVGYVVPAAGAGPIDLPSLRQALRRRLPEALVPALFVELAALPRTPSGKLDRKALPALTEGAEGDAGAGSPPEGPLEEALAGIWAEVLKRSPQNPQIGAEESFFALGGHSLLAALVATRVRERLGHEIPLAQLFEQPTIRGLAAWIGEQAGAAPASPFPPRPPGLSHFPLSFGQERLWLLDRLLADRSIYNVPAALEVRGPLDAGALAAAFAAVVARHEILRTTFAVQDGQGVQVVDAGPAPLLRLADLSRLPGDLAAGEAGRLMAEDGLRPFDLERGPVARATLVRLSAVLHHLLLTFHHIASDEWSTALLVDEIAALYRAATGGPPASLPALPVQYADFALWQRGAAGEIEEQLGYWREELAGAPAALELPVDRPWPAVASFRAEAVALEIPPDLSARLEAQAAGARATLFMLLLAGYGSLLARVTGQHDFLVGTPVARRHRRELEGVAGFFLNTLPLRLRLDPETAWSGLVEQVRETTVAAFARQDVPFERLVAELAPGRDLAASPLVQSLFVFTSTPAELPALPGLTLDPLAPPGSSAKFELTLHLGMAGGKIGGAFAFWTDLFDRPTVARLAGHFERLLAAAAEDPARPVGDLDGLSAAERHQLLREWNDAEDPETAAACLDELVERRVRAAPEAVAAVFEGEHLSYGELWERSLEAAGRLSAHGVGFETRVGLAFERSLEALQGLLGVLAAGGVAVFLDPRQPEERRVGLAADAGVGVILPMGEGLQGPQGRKGPRPPDGLAAILFTSGSTGRPKGVMLSHRGLAHRLLGSRGTCTLVPGDRVLHKAPAIFDIALWEVLAPLVAGATVVIARPGGHTDTAYLAELVLRERVTLAHFIPSILKLFLEELGLGEMGDLRAVFSGGEALPFGLRDRAGALLAADLYNQYGPTEASIDVSSGPALGGAGSDRSAFRAVPIGRPLGSTRLLVADASLRLVPPGALGELVIGGAHLARGYGGDAARTAERFVPDSFAAEPGGRLYRTGDRARHLADGRIEYAGRIDRQVKVRGVRIEPGEIEAALAALPGVLEAAVAVRVAPNGEALLAAYVSPPEPGGVAPEGLREALRRRLPEAMVPVLWVGLEALPRTPSGKLDRNALPAAGAAPGSRPPEGAIEPRLARLWEELLQVRRVGGEDDFFSLGGHSLLAIRLGFRIREAFGVELPPTAVFEDPVLAALAVRIDRAGRALARREVTPEEKREILGACRAQKPPAGVRSLAEIFVEQATARPEAPALTFEGKHLSYGEIEERSRRLARHLLALGVEPDAPVALFCERTPELVVALLAILRAGAAYVPLDPLLPEERLRYLLDDCGASLVLCGPGTPDLPGADGICILDLADLEARLTDSDSGPELPEHLDPTLTAYWIYTSGSTGNPKPVAVPHAQVARLLSSSEALFGFGPDDVWTLFHSYAFDFSVWEIWGALAYGGRLVIVPYLDSRSPADFARLLDEQQVTVLNQTPSAFYQLAAHAGRAGVEVGTSLSWVIFGGEPLEAGRLESWQNGRAGLPRLPRQVNMYGITETTVHVTFGEVLPGEPRGAGTAIGRPLPDLALYVLDAALDLCPREVTGELVVGGAGLARGYAGRPALTAERFVPDPYGGDPGARLYRSGDLGRLLPDGSFEHQGRADRQLKIRGFRIEPGEIEAALAAHSGVAQAAVIVRGERLVAYVVPREGDGAGGESLDTLRAFLAARLPSHMVPAAFVSLPRLPLTPNGKLDVRRLPEPAGDRPAGGAAYEPPHTAAQMALADIWSELLRIDRIDRIGLHDDFFTLGGHSLLVLRVDWRIREVFGVELPLTVLFERSTLADLAGRIERALEEEPATIEGLEGIETPFPRLDRAGGGPVEAPLSFAQQRLWFLHQLEPGDATYNMPFALRIEGPLDRRALAAALAEIVRRHEVLRTVYVAAADEPRQRVLPAPADSAGLLPLVDLSGLPAGRRASESTAVLGEVASRPFDLGARPPLRATLVSLTGEDHLAALTLHHIAGDAWSLDVLARELAALYAVFREGRPSPLPDLPVQYGDFALWQRTRLAGEVLARHLFFWRGQLAGAPPAHSLPFDPPRQADGKGGHGRADGRSLALGEAAAVRVRETGREHAATPFMVLLALWQVLLAQLGGETDVVVGTPVARRPRPELEGLIGFFVNHLALRADLAGELSFASHLARVRKATLGAFAHQDLPFERLVEELAPRRDRHRQPIFQLTFTLGGPPVLAPELPGLRVEPLGAADALAKFDLGLAATLDESGLALSLAFDAGLFDGTTIDRHLRHFAHLLEAALAAPERPLAEIDLLSEAERQQIETRPRLPPPARPILAEATAPASLTEQVLAEIWRDVLGVARVAREDSFFALGGHSLLATRLLFRLRERFSIELPLADVFDHPTLAELAARIEALDGAVDTPATPPADPVDPVDGSFTVVALPRKRHRIQAKDLDP